MLTFGHQPGINYCFFPDQCGFPPKQAQRAEVQLLCKHRRSSVDLFLLKFFNTSPNGAFLTPPKPNQARSKGQPQPPPALGCSKFPLCSIIQHLLVLALSGPRVCSLQTFSCSNKRFYCWGGTDRALGGKIPELPQAKEGEFHSQHLL